MLDVGGNGFEIGCSDCDFQRCFFMGFSLDEIKFENHVAYMEDEDKTRFTEILENNDVQSTEYDKPIYRCADCGEVVMKRYARVVYDDGCVLETRADCPCCNKRMQIVEHINEITELTCPVCRKGKIEIKNNLIWD
jgi:hypothetical protein